MDTFRWCRRTARLLIGLWLAYFLIIFLIRAQALLRFPFDYDQGEGYDVNSAWVLSQGGSPYASPDEYPFYSSNYPPLYALLLAPFVGARGPQLPLGRALSLIATALTIGSIGCTVYLESGRWRPGLAAALLFLASPYVYHTSPLARVNALMVVLALAGVYAVSQGASEPGRRAWGWLLSAGIMSRAALYTKQMAIDAVAAALLYLALRHRRRGLVLGSGLLSLGGILYLALDAATRGGFSLNILWANANPFDWQQAEVYYRNFLTIHLPLVVTGTALLVLTLVRRGPRGVSAYALYFVAALIVALGTGKWGAGESYFLSAIAAGSILVGQALAWVEATVDRMVPALWEKGNSRLSRAAPYCLVFLTCTVLAVQLVRYWHGPWSWPEGGLVDRGVQACVLGRTPTAEDIRAGERIVGHIAHTPGDVLAEECAFALRAGRPVLGNTTQQLNLYEAGRHDPAALVQALDQGKIGLVVLNAERYPAPVLDAIGRNCASVASYTINGFAYRVLECRRCCQ